MNRFLKHRRASRYGEAYQAHVVVNADDFVILSRGHANEALAWTRRVMTRLGLAIKEAKTSIRNSRQEPFDFLDCTFGPHHCQKNGHWYLGASASRKNVQRLKTKGRRDLPLRFSATMEAYEEPITLTGFVAPGPDFTVADFARAADAKTAVVGNGRAMFVGETAGLYTVSFNVDTPLGADAGCKATLLVGDRKVLGYVIVSSPTGVAHDAAGGQPRSRSGSLRRELGVRLLAVRQAGRGRAHDASRRPSWRERTIGAACGRLCALGLAARSLIRAELYYSTAGELARIQFWHKPVAPAAVEGVGLLR
jgi:hypothetical protein